MGLRSFQPTRRRFLQGCACVTTLALAPRDLFASSHSAHHLVAKASKANIVLEQGFKTSVWSYNDQIPGPLLRYRQGDTLSVEVENRLDEPTTVHWHGVRVPIAMDGVPHISQKPIAPNSSHSYEFKLEDAGTFWYHPHFNSAEQIGMGLHGILIVDEHQPPAADREALWVLDDWRMNQEAQLVEFSRNLRDASHNGRIGNVVTVNGTIEDEFPVYTKERIRLRLANVANARTFSLQFEGLNCWVVALDGHPIKKPRLLETDPITLGAGQRADLIVDTLAEPGSESMVIDTAYGDDFAYRLMRLKHRRNPVFTPSFRSDPVAISPNPVAEPDLKNSIRHEFTFEGGAMGGLAGARFDGQFKTMRELAQLGRLWATNGRVPRDAHFDPPLLRLDLGRSYIFQLSNQTAFEHPIHLHGHVFRVISRNGQLIDDPPLRDTVLIQPGEVQEIAFVADNPGKWMFHCHILEHQKFGMTSVIEVA